MFGALVLLYTSMCIIIFSLPCLWQKKGYRQLLLFFWTTTFALWYLFSPIYSGTPTILKSTERPIVQNGLVRNWGDTITCRPRIFRAKKHSDIVEAVQAAAHLRVVGSTHSWSALICSTDSILFLEYCDMLLDKNNTLIASAGCKISDIQTFLGLKGRILHGFGSIQGQTLAGASLTSLHGVQFDMFSSHIHKMEAVLANGTSATIHGPELRFWKSSMGMLGVVTKIYVKTFVHSSLVRHSRLLSFDDAMNILHNDSIHGLAITGVLEHDTFLVETFDQKQPANFTGLMKHSSWTIFGYDNIAQPLFMLFGRVLKPLNIIRLLYSDKSERIEMNKAWSHIVGYSSGSGSEYSVPLHECKNVLHSIRQLDKFSHVYIRKLQPNSDELSFAPVKSCCIEPYLFYTYNYQQDYKDYMHAIEALVKKAGGRTHWGKTFHLNYSGFVSKAFKDYRDSIDPNKKFMNDFTSTILQGHAYEYKPVVAGYRSIVWLTAFWTSLALTCISPRCPNISFQTAAIIAIDALTVLFAWISLVTHDNTFVNGHIHGENHKGIPWAVVWLIITIMLACTGVLKYDTTLRLRTLLSIVALIDAIAKLQCDFCNHGLSTLLMAFCFMIGTFLRYRKKNSTSRKLKYDIIPT